MSKNTFRLRILATSDIHMHVVSHDYFANGPTPGIGLLALENTIADLRTKAGSDTGQHHTLLLDNGDLLQGNALGDHLAETVEVTAPHPVAEVMNRLGYDAMGLGNHDLDFGLEYLSGFANTLNAPVLASNLRTQSALDWLLPDLILERGNLRIGLVSVMPPASLRGLVAKIGEPVQLAPIRDSATDTAARLRERGADIVIGLMHTGFGPDTSENALPEVAEDGAFDAIVGGHSHHLFPSPPHASQPGANIENGTLYGVPTIVPGMNAQALGCIDIDLSRDASGRWHKDRGVAQLVWPRPTASKGPTPAMDFVTSAHATTCRRLEEQVSRCTTRLHSYFARIQPNPLSSVAAAAQLEAIRPFVAQAGLDDLPLLSAVVPGRVGGRGGPRNFTDIPKGPFTARHLSQFSLHANLIWAVQISGAELREWLEKAASAFAQVDGDGTQCIVDSETPAFNFDTIYGIEYTIDPTKPARYPRLDQVARPTARRISKLTYKATPVKDTDEFIVAVNSYRACGGGGFPGLSAGRPVLRPDLHAADAMRRYVQNHAEFGLLEKDIRPWRFDPDCKGTRTWFPTGPEASDCLDDIAHLNPGTPQVSDSGFLHIPITL